MDFEARFEILRQAGMLTAEDEEKVRQVIAYFEQHYQLRLTEENASSMIMHLCASLDRIRRGEPVEPLDPEVYEETRQDPVFDQALEATREIVRNILPGLPEEEQKFLTMHIGVLLAQK